MFYFKDDTQVTVYFSDGNSAVWKADSPHFKGVVERCEKNDWIPIQILHNTSKAVMENRVEVVDDGIRVMSDDYPDDYYTDIPFDGVEDPLIKFINVLRKSGIIESEIDKVKPFILNMFQNPYISAVEEIYEYCKAQDFEITEDGCLLAYKNVNKDYSSIYDNGATKHAIGKYTEVEQFDTNRNKKCSNGLHFCAKSYLPEYTGDMTIVVKVNPRDIVSIPTDYNFAKGRCKRYMMVGVVGKENNLVTDLATASNEKVVKKSKVVEATNEDRISITYLWFDRLVDREPEKELSLIYEEISNIMHISVETVKRNIRKYKERNR